MQNLKVLNIHKINLYQVVNIMFRVENDTFPSVFNKESRISIDHI